MRLNPIKKTWVRVKLRKSISFRAFEARFHPKKSNLVLGEVVPPHKNLPKSHLSWADQEIIFGQNLIVHTAMDFGCFIGDFSVSYRNILRGVSD